MYNHITTWFLAHYTIKYKILVSSYIIIIILSFLNSLMVISVAFSLCILFNYPFRCSTIPFRLHWHYIKVAINMLPSNASCLHQKNFKEG